MMTSRKFVDYLEAEPFRPFRINMTSGQHYDVRHPEMIMVGKTTTRVYSANDPAANERWHDLSMLLIESIEPLDVPVGR
jgi:hypothetical protein